MQGLAGTKTAAQPMANPSVPLSSQPPRLPRLGFLGVGWIGRHRMERLIETAEVEAAVIADASAEALDIAASAAPTAARAASMDELLEHDLDGVVIATPSAMHAPQALAALRRGLAVFCQKPLARTAAEAGAIVDAARDADRLLGVDLSYRYTAAYTAIAGLIRQGELGELYSLDLTFHNAYGPDKPWFRDAALSGGGCLIDLGVHLVDLALLSLGWPRIDKVSGHLFAGGAPLGDPAGKIEDHATVDLTTAAGQSIRIACSWNLHAGRDAVIECAFHGTRSSAMLRNVDGSFYDFIAEQFTGTSRRVLVEPPDAWGGRAAIAWARRLALTPNFDPEAARLVEVSRIIDMVYGR
jgi:predicted dehydrogenase